MATFDFTVTGSSIIQDAMGLIGAREEGEPIEGDIITDVLRSLNMLAKSWVAHGYHRHRKQEVIIPLNTGQKQYFLGPASGDAEWADENDFVSTQLNGSAASAATSLTLDSTTGILKDDRIGIELADSTKPRQWTTVQSITSSTALVIVTALTGAASDNATVYSYTTRPQRPLRVLHARRRTTPTGNDIETWRLSDEEYQSQPQKETTGTPVNYNYKPAKSDGTIASGTFSVWQPPNDSRMQMRLTVERPPADFDVAGDNPDWPIEWSLAFTYNLALILEPEHGVLSAARRRDLRDDAEDHLEMVKSFDLDTGSILFRPRWTF